jgi:BRCT domain type II-containing protein
MTEQVKQDKITIDGKDYIISDLPLELRNTIVARQEIQQSKVRHEVELEKIEVLTNFYNDKISKGLKEINGGDSKSTD